MAQPFDIDLWVMKSRSAWSIFHGPVTLPYILKTIWCMNIIVQDYMLVQLDVWPQKKWRSLTLTVTYISWSSDFALYLEDYLMYESVWPDIWPKRNVGHWDLYFTVHWFCLISWTLRDVWTSYFGIMSQYDPTFDLKINVCHCDLYFMVHWFCLISWRLFYVWTSYFEIMSQYDPMFDLKLM